MVGRSEDLKPVSKAGGASRLPHIQRGAALALTCIASAVLAACAVGPDFKQTAAPKVDSYTMQSLPDTTASAPGVAGDAQHFVMGRDIPFAWWEQFNSAKLNALVERSLKANPTIPAAQAALKQAQEYVAAQGGYFYPNIGLGLNAQRQKAPVSSGSPGIYNLYTSQLNLSYTPDVLGSNRRQVESLKAQAEQLRFQMAATYISLANNVVAAVIQEASLQDQIDAVQALLLQNEKAVRILHDQARLGYAMAIDVAAQELTLAQAQASLPPLQKQLEQTHDLIRALVGGLPNEALDDNFHLADLTLPQDLPVTLPSRLVAQRPDVRAAEEQVHAASARVGVALAARLPQFNISGAIGGQANQFGQMFSSGGALWTIAAGLTQPIFDGGTLMHNQRAAEQGLLQAQAQYQSAVITAFQNVADTLHAVQSDANALVANQKAEKAAKVVMDLTLKKQQLGYVDTLTLLTAQEAYQQAELALIQAQTNRYGDTAALFQAVGGGWWNLPELN
ncbi:MAG: efflux transporter outer membrane subunit [Burkholderiaceae bacterium]|nr:efflux transporter outer membrane subunit [Burkholderiaceae bacterium]